MRSARVVEVEGLGDRILKVTFDDGLVRELDLAGTLTGVLASLDDDETFASVSVDDTAGTVSWPNGLDLDPDVLHGDYAPANGKPARLIAEYYLRQTG